MDFGDAVDDGEQGGEKMREKNLRTAAQSIYIGEMVRWKARKVS